MDRFKRITVKDVKKAYKDTGLKPTTMFMYDAQDHSACALGALLLAGGWRCVEGATMSDAAKALNLPLYYVLGFALGFDKSPGEPLFTVSLLGCGDLGEVKRGIRDGRKVGKSIFGAGPRPAPRGKRVPAGPHSISWLVGIEK